jgi:hypothetical protein
MQNAFIIGLGDELICNTSQYKVTPGVADCLFSIGMTAIET